MNLSFKNRVRSASCLRPGDPAARRAGKDRRHRAAAKNSAKIPGADSGQPEAGRLRRIAPGRGGRLPSGEGLRPDNRRRSSPLRSKNGGKARVKPRMRSRICGPASMPRFRLSLIARRLRSWLGAGRKRRPGTCPTGIFEDDRNPNGIRGQFVQHRAHAPDPAQPDRRRQRGHDHRKSVKAATPTALFGEMPDRSLDDLGRGEARHPEARQGAD